MKPSMMPTTLKPALARKATVAEAQLQAGAKENNACCALYTSSMNHEVAQWDDDSQGATISFVDLTSTDNERGTNFWKDE
ncbi:Hydroxymethylglutaryl-CoA lyase, mitochondrial [Hordeum vulgare]|nr:Hydroxymethylglutaryl-CoA lyase, mitochondrial [Hordeum vulgare]